MFPHDDLWTANSTLDRAVLLSERTQLIAIKAIAEMEAREAWETTTDAEWDDLDKYIGDALTEILGDIEGLPMQIEFKNAYKTNTQALVAGAETAVLFNNGDHAAPPNFNRIRPELGRVTITGFVLVSAAVATQITVSIRKNGTDKVVSQSFFNASLSQRMSLTVSDECDDDDYYELMVVTNQASTIQNTEFAFLKWLRWYETP